MSKVERDTGGGCSVCGAMPAVNIHGTYWLCGPCVFAQTAQLAAMRAAGEAMAVWAEEQCADFDPEMGVIQDALAKIAAWRKASGN